MSLKFQILRHCSASSGRNRRNPIILKRAVVEISVKTTEFLRYSSRDVSINERGGLHFLPIFEPDYISPSVKRHEQFEIRLGLLSLACAKLD